MNIINVIGQKITAKFCLTEQIFSARFCPILPNFVPALFLHDLPHYSIQSICVGVLYVEWGLTTNYI